MGRQSLHIQDQIGQHAVIHFDIRILNFAAFWRFHHRIFGNKILPFGDLLWKTMGSPYLMDQDIKKYPFNKSKRSMYALAAILCSAFEWNRLATLVEGHSRNISVK